MQPEDTIFLGGICREYEAGIDHSVIENFDGTNFVFDMDNGRVLDVKGTKRITYTEISSGRHNSTVCMRITGGPSCQIADPIIVFKNTSRNYHIQAVPDDVLGVYSEHSQIDG